MNSAEEQAATEERATLLDQICERVCMCVTRQHRGRQKKGKRKGRACLDSDLWHPLLDPLSLTILSTENTKKNYGLHCFYYSLVKTFIQEQEVYFSVFHMGTSKIL